MERVDASRIRESFLVFSCFGWAFSFGFGVGWREAGPLSPQADIVVSVRPGWARNYFTYFFVYSARCCDAPARGLGQSRGHQWGEAVYSQVFERRLPPGPVAILKLTGVGRRCLGPASLMSHCKHVFHLDESRIDCFAEQGQRCGVSDFFECADGTDAAGSVGASNRTGHFKIYSQSLPDFGKALGETGDSIR